MSKTNEKKLVHQFDWFTMSIIIALTCFSLLFIATATASPATGETEGLQRIAQMINPYYVMLQLAWFVVGTLLLVLTVAVDYHVYGAFIRVAYIVMVGLLLALLGLNVAIRGTRGWFNFGERGFQPAELMKIVLIITLAKMCATAMEKKGSVNGFVDLMKIVGVLAVPTALVMLQPDWGTAFVYICILIGILFAARISYKIIIGAVAIGAGVLPAAYFLVMADWQRDRINSFLGIANDAMGADYNVNASKLAIGSGQIFGKGLFADGSLVQLDFLPEKRTDFIFSSGVEATGFVGGAIIILLYFALLLRTLYIATRAKDQFGSLICVGVLAMELAHIFENISMVMGIMPVTGIPLPFISYGGSSMLTNLIAFGLVINVWMRRSQKRFTNKTVLALS